MPSQRLIKTILANKIGFHNIKQVDVTHAIKGFMLNIKHNKIHTRNPSIIHGGCSLGYNSTTYKIIYNTTEESYIKYLDQEEIISDIEFLELWGIKIESTIVKNNSEMETHNSPVFPL
jgi:hypothetical protein